MSEMDDILVYILIGFFAQMVDGTLGMAYGVTSTTFLLSAGIPPAAASATIHTAELFTTAVLGLSHIRLGNVDKTLFKRLAIPGVTGGALGAYVLTEVPGDRIKPFMAGYLLLMGLVILYRAFRKTRVIAPDKTVVPLGLVGGFFDAVGGGGWGPIVTSTLVARGVSPRMTIGSVNTAEFFVTVAESAIFILAIGLTCWSAILGLIIGGVIAAPLAAYLCAKIPSKLFMVLIGLLISLLSLRTLYLSLLG